jgi:hypothetical protein
MDKLLVLVQDMPVHNTSSASPLKINLFIGRVFAVHNYEWLLFLILDLKICQSVACPGLRMYYASSISLSDLNLSWTKGLVSLLLRSSIFYPPDLVDNNIKNN